MAEIFSIPVRRPLWAALREREAPATIAELSEQIGARPNSVQLRLLSWQRAGLLTVTLHRRKIRKSFLMTAQARKLPAPPKMDIGGGPVADRDGRARMWRAIRTLRRFDLPTLTMAATVTRRSAEDYINCLMRAAILRRETRGNSRTCTWSTYALAGDHGPRTPVVRHRKGADGLHIREVFDPNTGKTHDISPRRAALFFEPRG